jgi:hypothetical protein
MDNTSIFTCLHFIPRSNAGSCTYNKKQLLLMVLENNASAESEI